MTDDRIRAVSLQRLFYRAEARAAKLNRRDAKRIRYGEITTWTANGILEAVAQNEGVRNAAFINEDRVNDILTEIETWGRREDDPPF